MTVACSEAVHSGRAPGKRLEAGAGVVHVFVVIIAFLTPCLIFRITEQPMSTITPVPKSQLYSILYIYMIL